MAASKLPDIGFVRECLDYDPDTGVFTWRERPRSHFVSNKAWNIWKTRFAGNRAGAVRQVGRPQICWGITLAYVPYRAHRLAWLFVHGTDPGTKEIDHIDGDPLNNRISNLRLATRRENTFNTRKLAGTRSGIKGVWVNSIDGKFDAIIKTGGKRIYLGHFQTKEEAAEARREAAIRLHGEFVRHE